MEDLPTTAGNDILVENAGGGVMFKEIGDERTFNGILNQITDNIQSGRLKAGDALPAERTMAETMGVSRRQYVRRSERWSYLESSNRYRAVVII